MDYLRIHNWNSKNMVNNFLNVFSGKIKSMFERKQNIFLLNINMNSSALDLDETDWFDETDLMRQNSSALDLDETDWFDDTDLMTQNSSVLDLDETDWFDEADCIGNSEIIWSMLILHFWVWIFSPSVYLNIKTKLCILLYYYI